VSWRCPQCQHRPTQEDDIPLFAPALARANSGFKPEFFSDLAALEAGHFWFRNRNRLLVWALRSCFPVTTRFLEVGCGTGFVLTGLRQAFPEMQLTGGEVFIEGLRFARTRLPDVPLFQIDAAHLPFEAAFDVVGAFDVLEHIEEDCQVLQQIHQAVRPGGGLLVTVPQHRWLWSEEDDRACHKRRYTRRELVSKVESAGFKVIRVTSFVSLLLPLMWVSRKQKNPSTGVFEPNFALNCLLELVLRVETWFIRQGWSFPAGGSLLLAAQKE
jgi:SAM-dependent methyltransferase